MDAPVMTADELTEFLDREFGQVSEMFRVEDVQSMAVKVRLLVQKRHLRPGGTVSGPSIFSLCDVGVYLAILAMVGPEALAVTTNCSIDFMRKPNGGADLISHTRLLKLGSTLVVGDVLVFSETTPDLAVARATLTYSRPRRA